MSLAIKTFRFKSSWKKIFYVSVKLGSLLNTLLSHILNITVTEGVCKGILTSHHSKPHDFDNKIPQ